jgi:hypothetical protein
MGILTDNPRETLMGAIASLKAIDGYLAAQEQAVMGRPDQVAELVEQRSRLALSLWRHREAVRILDLHHEAIFGPADK